METHTTISGNITDISSNIIPSSGDASAGLDTTKIRNAFNTFKTCRKLTEHYAKSLEILLKSFPNAAIVEYVNYLNDYNRCAELDVVRKIEVLRETLKIMGEISHMEVHEGLNLGVVDFSINNEYVYIDYVTPVLEVIMKE